jgi:type I restriction enzyme S subunit
VVGGRVDLTDVKYVDDPAVDVSGYRVREGDILIVRTNGSRSLIGRSAVVDGSLDAAFASYLIRYRVNHEIVTARWVQVALSSPQGRATLESMAASSAGQYNLSLSKLDNVEIPVPSLSEQARLIHELDELKEWSERLSQGIAMARLKSESLRRTLLTAAFSGRLTAHAPMSTELRN